MRGDYDNTASRICTSPILKKCFVHNNGNGTFTDVSEKAHVAGSGKMWGTGCAFVITIATAT